MQGNYQVNPGDTMNLKLTMGVQANQGPFDFHILMDNQGPWVLVRGAVTKNGELIHIMQETTMTFGQSQVLKSCRPDPPRFTKGGERIVKKVTPKAKKKSR